MDRKEDRDILRKGGFVEQEVVRLNKLRSEHVEKQRRQAQVANRRLEFARWLFSNGKISDQIA